MQHQMDQELREKFARLDAQVESLLVIPSKLDSIMQLQVTMASVQENMRGNTEKLALVINQVKDNSEQISSVSDRLTGLRSKIIGGSLVICSIVIPVTSYIVREMRDQLVAIDRRVDGIEVDIKMAGFKR